VSSEAYTSTSPRVWLIHIDHDYVQQVMNIGNFNQSATNDLRCSPCQSVIHFDPKPTAAMTEADFQTGPGPINTQAYSEFWKDWTATTTGTEICFTGFPAPRTSVAWTETCVNHLKGESMIKQYIMGGFTTISFEQKVYTWMSFAFNGDFPDDFTMLPPP
ncbi:MAG TPA: hypothetical protein VI818_01505, partial [Candidatus Thermoplasmatota archaeon]|nr:hypothetical protein [Candidatus Thermoplasmatota archaeon]